MEEFQAALENVVSPLTIEEAYTLMTLLGPDDCYGLAWSLLHKIETAKGLSIEDLPQECSSYASEWITRLEIE